MISYAKSSLNLYHIFDSWILKCNKLTIVIEKKITIILVVFYTQWHLKGKLCSIYLGSFMNHRLSFEVTREDFESDASIRNAVTNTKQIGDRCSMNKTLRYLLLKVKERARTFPVTYNFVQLYVYIYM